MCTYLPWLLIPLLSLQAICVTLMCGLSPDEYNHIHFMWLIHRGLLANVDFLCPYPTLFYRLFGFLLDVFPNDAAFLIYARIFSLSVLGLTALLACAISKQACDAYWPGVVAMLLPPACCHEAFRQFRPDTFAYVLFLLGLLLLCRWPSNRSSIAAAAFLAVFSLLVMPKHVFLVGGAALGYLIMGCKTRSINVRQSLIWASVGLFAALAVGAFIIRADLASFKELLSLATKTGFYRGEGEATLASSLAMLLFSSTIWPIAVLLLTAPVLVVVRLLDSKKRLFKHHALPWQYRGIAAGVLLAAIAYPFFNTCPYSQSQAVLFIAAAIGMALVADTVPLPHMSVLATGLLAACLYLVWPSAKQGIKDASTLKHIELQAILTKLIPENEYQVSMSFTAPTFRPDPSYIYLSEVRAYRDIVPAEKRKYFTEPYFYERLCATRPAYFCFFTMGHQPPEYLAACQKYLTDNEKSYASLAIDWSGMGTINNGKLPIIVRKDLLK